MPETIRHRHFCTNPTAQLVRLSRGEQAWRCGDCRAFTVTEVRADAAPRPKPDRMKFENYILRTADRWPTHRGKHRGWR